ncbi:MULTISPECIES: SGNH/GDSL hydrolase family protein [Agrobacterium]|jgi:lysophospholipase L1-like esterase|uniref:Arylesterase n=2 Tax=Agrobacterium fabrum TaxID=1176649 RepID=A9CJ31_AGRFC|nr:MULTISPECIES: SGNH/GDSL hydrolase family protein [Agrobacterium]KJX88626.1 arylesterase [Agrobacterium tumefaciens]AAK87224.1 arylesterase [Agrobacterium fabrum str. C58]EGL64702.1 arylesterase [Agrobacterium sp. ATCC 31749]MCR6725108.1 SGNH/GDSL hydrolase family protein [Agrobacterium fabrum]MCX2873743.1 SGNH/GDSL hydrolase family protein [Agrobacterium fabrum]
MVKSVLCFGDSLTWGSNAETGGRHSHDDLWPSVLQKALGSDVHVIHEGLGGRTTAYDDHTGDCDRNGARLLPTLLHSHAPLDMVIIMLGTNDMKPAIHGSAIVAMKGVERLVKLTRNHVWQVSDWEAPDVLIVAPPQLCETANPFMGAIFRDAIDESAMLASVYRDLADELDCGFFDAGSVARTTPVDGVHLDAENTRAIGRGLEPVVRMMLGL